MYEILENIELLLHYIVDLKMYDMAKFILIVVFFLLLFLIPLGLLIYLIYKLIQSIKKHE